MIFALGVIVRYIIKGEDKVVDREKIEIQIEGRLDVSFGGAFSTEYAYTNPTGEIKDGDLLRRTGEEVIEQGRMVLNGRQDGVIFNPRASIEDADGFVIEIRFTAKETPEIQHTILSVGGSLYVRYATENSIEYGFDVNTGGDWISVKEAVNAPDLNTETTIAIVYTPTEDGAVLRAFMNGVELPSAISTEGAPVLGNTDEKIGFGNEVHPQGQDRGLEGSLSTAVLTSFTGEFDPAFLKTMDLTSMTRELFALGIGELKNNAYQPKEDEQIEGELTIEGGAITGFGQIELSGTDSFISYIPSADIVDQTKLNGSYIAEIIVEADKIQSETMLIDLAGAVRLQGSGQTNSVDLVINENIEQTLDLADVEIEDGAIHFALIYNQTAQDKIEVTVQSYQMELGAVRLDKAPQTSQDQLLFAKGLTGHVYGLGFSSFNGEYIDELLSLLGGPAIMPTDLEPGHQIPIDPNEYAASLAAKASLVRPLPKQVQWQEYEQTAFIHYGINTYYGVEWGDLWKHDDPKIFNPTDLDTDQWARTLRDSGFKMAVLTVKHHDGFALYPSRYTDFSVANSEWRDGQGNVLREFVDSMRKYGIEVGIYLSPADHSAFRDGVFANESVRKMRSIPTFVEGDDRANNSDLPTFKLEGTDYGKMFMNQLYEVLTEYGKIDEVWFDGAQGHIPGNTAEAYDWDSIYSLINALQPEAVIAVTGPDVRWVGNESGWARDNEWSVLAATMLEDGKQAYHPEFSAPDLGSRRVLQEAAANGMEYLTWWPAEVDVSIRSGWFHHENQEPKSIDQLREIYYQSIARNSVLLLNIPPNKAGKFDERDVARLIEWHESINRDFEVNHTLNAKVEAENGATGSDPSHVIDEIYETSWEAASTEPSALTFTFDELVKVERIILQENIHHGQQMESFTIEAQTEAGDWEEIYANESVGYKRIIVLDEPIEATGFRLNILQSRGPVHLSEVGFYRRSED